MPQEIINENKKVSKSSRWHGFHFSGKVIMCSVLFGLGIVLVGGLVMAIGKDQNSDSKSNNLDEIQNRAPMVVVGPVLMGIGVFTVITGIIMCLFEMNICRKREPDSKPLIEEYATEEAARGSGQTPIISVSQKREKHRNHKKSSKKHQVVPKYSHEKTTIESSDSPFSRPMNVQASHGFTTSDQFVTPSSSFVPSVSVENQSLVNSDKSWNTSTEFQTPSSSLQSSESFEVKGIDRKENFSCKEIDNNQLQIIHHDFLTPKNSNAESRNYDQKDQMSINGLQKTQNKELCSINDASTDNLKHHFVTTKNSTTHDFEMPKNIPLENTTENISEKIPFSNHEEDMKNIDTANDTKGPFTRDMQCPLNSTEEAESMRTQNTSVDLQSENTECNNVSEVLENGTDLTASASQDNHISPEPES